jgi:hypothetical protein
MQPPAIALGQTSGRVHQRGSYPYQAGPRSNHRQVRLRLRAAVLHRAQQLGIDPGQACQSLGVEAVILFPALSGSAARFAHGPRSPRVPTRLTIG